MKLILYLLALILGPFGLQIIFSSATRLKPEAMVDKNLITLENPPAYVTEDPRVLHELAETGLNTYLYSYIDVFLIFTFLLSFEFIMEPSTWVSKTEEDIIKILNEQ